MKLYFKVLLYRLCSLLLFIKSIAAKGWGQNKKRALEENHALAQVKKILICETALMGDVVCAHPLIHQVAALFPHAEITVVVQKQFKAVVKDNPEIKKVVSVNGTSLRDIVRVITTLFLEKYDLIIAPSPGIRNAVISLTASIGSRQSIVTGYLSDTSPSPRFYNDHIISASSLPLKWFFPLSTKQLKYNRTEHLTTRALKAIIPIMNALDSIPVYNKRQPRLYLNEQREGVHLNALKQEGLISNGKITVVIHPSASQSFKQWPLKNFVNLLNMITKNLSASVIPILIGAGGETKRLSTIQKEVSPTVRCLVDASLDQVMTLIKHSALFIGNDSGPKFLADGFNVPVIEMMGSLPPSTAGVLNPVSWSFYAKAPCSPCRQEQCRMNRQCLRAITPKEVYMKALETITSTPSIQGS